MPAKAAPATPSVVPQGNTLPGWGMYLNGGRFDPTQIENNPFANTFLTALHQYDPGASFQAQQYGSDAGGGTYYTLNTDWNKLPANWNMNIGGGSKAGTGMSLVDVNPGDYAGALFDPTESGANASTYKSPYGPDFRDRLINPNLKGNVPGLGTVTVDANRKPEFDSMSIWGPAIMSLVTMGAGAGLMGAAGAGAGAAGAAGAGMTASQVASLMGGFSGITQGLANGGKFNPASLIGIIGGLLGVPGWESSLATQGVNAAEGHGVNPINAILATLHGINQSGG